MIFSNLKPPGYCTEMLNRFNGQFSLKKSPLTPLYKGGKQLTSPFIKGSELQARLTGLRGIRNGNLCNSSVHGIAETSKIFNPSNRRPHAS